MYADLHIHSWYSDGTMSVDEIVEQARIRQVGLIAVTDHNQLSGSRECLQKTRGTGIRCLSGVELDAQDFGINFHILGYGVDLENGQFQAFVEANRLRLERVNELLIEKMEHAGEPVSLDEYRQFSYDRRSGGWKALHYFAAKDLVADFKQGFSIYARYHHDYCCVGFPPVREVVRQIHAAKGKAILAHPGKVIPAIKLSEVLAAVMAEGLDGIECWYPAQDPDTTQICVNYCRERDLMMTSGADCHGSFEKTQIGQLEIPISQLVLKHWI